MCAILFLMSLTDLKENALRDLLLVEWEAGRSIPRRLFANLSLTKVIRKEKMIMNIAVEAANGTPG